MNRRNWWERKADEFEDRGGGSMRFKRNTGTVLWVARVSGAVLLLAGLGLIASTERGMTDYRVTTARHGGDVLDLGDQGRPAAGQYGSTTRISGTPKVVEAPRDPEFNVSADTPVLIRHVEMFQWREITLGTVVHYELDWVDRPLDSSRFAQPGGHGNPGAFPIAGRQFDAGRVRMGNFLLSTPLLHALPGSMSVKPDLKNMPANLAATFQLVDDRLVTSARPNSPRLGDLRVSWEAVPLQVLTVVARIDGDSLVPAAHAADGQGFDVQVGDRTLLDVRSDLPEPPGFVPFRRVLSVLLAGIGGLLLAYGSARLRRDGLFGLGIGAIVVGAVAGVMWLGADVPVALAWLAMAACGVGLAVWRSRQTLAPAKRV
jgi:Transmembrane protein 43